MTICPQCKLAQQQCCTQLQEIRKWAEGLRDCTHQLCSLAESNYEEKYANEALDILNKEGQQ